jgi:hypothetical protein
MFFVLLVLGVIMPIYLTSLIHQMLQEIIE